MYAGISQSRQHLQQQMISADNIFRCILVACKGLSTTYQANLLNKKQLSTWNSSFYYINAFLGWKIGSIVILCIHLIIGLIKNDYWSNEYNIWLNSYLSTEHMLIKYNLKSV